MNYFFFDCETTGFSPKKGAEILSMGAVLVDSKFAILDKFYGFSRPRPNSYWNLKAEEVHGFTEEQARKFPYPIETQEYMLEWLKPYNGDLTFVSHCQGNFDADFFWSWVNGAGTQFEFRKYLNYERQENTLKMCREKLQLKQNSLDKVCEHFGINFVHHNALEDAMACYKVYCELIKGDYLA